MHTIVRDTDQFTTQRFDIIVVGGGIYGVFLALQAARRSLRPLLLERDDFGGKTSFNSLRIIHGGLRYLQTADLRRFAESVSERRWFLENFPDLVSPMPCLMPLYGKGVRRKPIMRMAMLANDTLSYRRNNGVPRQNRIDAARVIGAGAALNQCPDLLRENLKGGALWHDASVDDSQRIIIELLRWAIAKGATAVNYANVTRLLTKANKLCGVAATDSISGKELEFRAPVVVNAAGPWSEDLAARMGDRRGDIFDPSIAWNLWMDRPAASPTAMALTAARPNAPTYFMRPWKGRMLVGTGHSAWTGGLENPLPTEQQVELMLADINDAAPRLALKPDDVRHIFAGLLPARQAGSAELAVRPAMVRHERSDEFRGLFTICGVKFTTARKVASDTLDMIFGRSPGVENPASQRPEPTPGWQSAGLNLDNNLAKDRFFHDIEALINNESVQHLTDLVFRRTDLWENPDVVRRIAPDICKRFDWDRERTDWEIRNLFSECGLPGRFDTSSTSASNYSNG